MDVPGIHHCEGRADPLLAGVGVRVEAIGDWSEWLTEGEDDAATQALRMDTCTGRPLGAARLPDWVEGFLGRPVHAKRKHR